MLITELRSKSQKIAVQARELLDTITDENRSEKEAEFDRMMSESDDLAKRAERAEKAESRAREFDSPVTEILAGNVTVEGRGEDSAEVEARAYRSFLRGEVRALATKPDADGGYTVPATLQAELIKAMKAFGPLNEGGPVRYISTSGGGTISFPTTDYTGQDAPAIAENAQAGEAGLTFGQVSLGAHKITSGIFRVSNELLADSAIDVAGEVNTAIAEIMGRKLNKLFTTGSGEGEARGIVTAAQVGVTAASATAIAFDEIIRLIHSVDPAYRSSPNFGLMFSDNFLQAVRLLKDNEGRYVWTPSTVEGAPDRVAGKSFWINQAMAPIATGNVVALAGDFSKFAVRRAGAMSVKVLTERYADYDQTAFVAFGRADSNLLAPGAVRALKMA